MVSQTIESNTEAEASVAPPNPTLDLPLTVIEAKSGWHLIDMHELWRYRELLVILSWRDLQVRYKQTVLGVAWAVLQPLATMLVFSLFFGRVAEMPSGEIAYPLFAFAGLLPWFFFSNAINSAGQSVVGNQSLVTKVYFPRLLIPMCAIGVHFLDFAIGFVLLLLMIPCFGRWPSVTLLLAPFLALLLAVAALAAGTLLSALTVAYRDFRFVVPFMIQLWMFATPAVYLQTDAIGPYGRALLPLNPAHGLILNFRAAVLGTEFDPYALIVSGVVSVTLLLAGCHYFRRVERSFADII